jgi:hypothetical protein
MDGQNNKQLLLPVEFQEFRARCRTLLNRVKSSRATRDDLEEYRALNDLGARLRKEHADLSTSVDQMLGLLDRTAPELDKQEVA